MRFGFYAGETDKTIYLRLRDSTTGLAKTGLAFNSAGAVCSYVLPLAARAAITLATQTVTGAHSDGGFVEVDATNCKGLYRLDLPDAAIASGSFSVVSIEFDGTIEESILLEIDTQKVNATQFAGQTITAAAGVTLPSSVASPTNITAGTITTVTNLTNLPTIPNNWLTAAGIADDAITAAKIANGAIDAATFAADVDAEIRSYVGLASANLDTQLADIPTVAEFEARTLVAASYFDPAADTVANVTTVGSVTGSVGSVTGAINTAAGTITTLDALDTAQDTQHSTTQGRLPAALVGGRIDATVDATGMEAGAITAILTTAMTEAYAADGAAPTLAQALFLIQQTLTEFVISGTTLTIKKIDGTTTAATLTLNDATTPTGATRAT